MRELAEDRGIAILHPVLSCVSPAQASGLANASIVVAQPDTTRRPGLCLEDAADLPTAQDLAGEVLIGLQERQLVQEVYDQHMPAVEFRRPIQVVCVVCVWNDVALVRPVIRALAEGVGSAEPESACET